MANDRFVEESTSIYRNKTYVIAREWGPAPFGGAFAGLWVVRVIATGEYIDHSQYREDLMDRYR